MKKQRTKAGPRKAAKESDLVSRKYCKGAGKRVSNKGKWCWSDGDSYLFLSLGGIKKRWIEAKTNCASFRRRRREERRVGKKWDMRTVSLPRSMLRNASQKGKENRCMQSPFQDSETREKATRKERNSNARFALCRPPKLLCPVSNGHSVSTGVRGAGCWAGRQSCRTAVLKA